ncbi:MAG: hypothetical protein RL538_55 [Candidatus Parcubacteria bacterium]|jgi:hypothetical protein
MSEVRQSVRWLPRQEVTEALKNCEVLVRTQSGGIEKATILSVSHDCEGRKSVKYESEGRHLTRSYELTDRETDFSFR